MDPRDREEGRRRPSSPDVKHRKAPTADKMVRGPEETKGLSSDAIQPKPDRR